MQAIAKDPYLRLKPKPVKTLIKRAVGRLLTCRSLQEADVIVTQLYLLMTNEIATPHTNKAVDIFLHECAADNEDLNFDHNVRCSSANKQRPTTEIVTILFTFSGEALHILRMT